MVTVLNVPTTFFNYTFPVTPISIHVSPVAHTSSPATFSRLPLQSTASSPHSTASAWTPAPPLACLTVHSPHRPPSPYLPACWSTSSTAHVHPPTTCTSSLFPSPSSARAHSPCVTLLSCSTCSSVHISSVVFSRFARTCLRLRSVIFGRLTMGRIAGIWQGWDSWWWCRILARVGWNVRGD